MGLLSLLDAVVGRPKAELLEEVSVPEDIKNTLLDGQGRFGGLLKLTENYDKGEWQTMSRLASSLGLEETDLSPAYIEAVGWAREVFFI